MDTVALPRLECEPAVMTGTAGVGWGYVEGGPEMTATPYMRVEGHLEHQRYRQPVEVDAACSLQKFEAWRRSQCEECFAPQSPER